MWQDCVVKKEEDEAKEICNWRRWQSSTRRVVGCTRWSMQCRCDVKASASGSSCPRVNKKRRSITSWHLVSREAETAQFFPTRRTQMKTVWPVNKHPDWPGLKSSVCVQVVFGTCCVTICFALLDVTGPSALCFEHAHGLCTHNLV